MFDGVIRIALRHRPLVLVAALVWLVWGVSVVLGLPIDVFPDLNRPSVTLMTEAGGLSPEEVEVVITRPIEQAMSGAPGVQVVRSQSAVGLSVIQVEFGWDVDVMRARQMVTERLTTVRDELPPDVVPTLGPISSVMGEILLVGVASADGSVSGPALRRLAEVDLRPLLRAIPGVSSVTVLGGGLETIEVSVHPATLAARGLTLDDVKVAAAQAQGATTGGFLERKSEEYLVRNLARTADPVALGQTVVGVVGGTPIALSEVADVRRGVGVKRGDAGVNGKGGVILSVQKQPGASTLALTTTIQQALDTLRPSLPAHVEVVTLFRQADFIGAAVGNVEEALRDGAILVAIVLAMFLLSWRTTAITLTAIPLSFVTSAVVMHALGMSINTMTLGGLAIAIGELVDDAIVDVENVWRRVRENAALPAPRPVLRVVLDASIEVRSAVVFSTALVVLVFVPLFALSGIEGRLFAPLGIAYITSILASLVVSLTVTPVLASYLLPAAAASATAHADGRLVRMLKRWDRALLERVLDRPVAVMGVSGLLVVVALASTPWIGVGFLPPFQEGTATVNMLARPGTSLEESNHLGTLAEQLLLSTPEVASVGRRTGRAEGDEHAEGVHYTEIDVDFHEGGRPRDTVLAELRARLAQLPGVVVNLGQPISHRLDHMLSGVRAAIAVKLFGEDLASLRQAAATVEQAVVDVPGLVDLQTEAQVLVPQIHVAIRRDAALRFGLTPGALSEDLETALGGSRVATVVEGLRGIDVVVRVDASARADLDTIRSLPLITRDGRAITVGQLADVSLSTGPNEIKHEGGRRRLVVSANTAGRDVGSVVDDLTTRLEHVTLPAGVRWVIEGQHQGQRDAARRIAALSALSLLGMIAVLYAHLRSGRLVAQVLLNIPLALVGAIAAIWVSGGTASVASLVGLVTLCGIATRNTILMITHYLHLMREEGEVFGREMIVRGSLERLVPVLMTALCAGLGLVPLAFADGDPGKEILTPVARVILGGLLSSTLLDALVTPTVFLWFGAGAVPPPDDDGLVLDATPEPR